MSRHRRFVAAVAALIGLVFSMVLPSVLDGGSSPRRIVAGRSAGASQPTDQALLAFVEVLRAQPGGAVVDYTPDRTFAQLLRHGDGAVIGTIAAATPVRGLPSSWPIPTGVPVGPKLTRAAIDLSITLEGASGTPSANGNIRIVRLTVYDGPAGDAAGEHDLDRMGSAVPTGCRVLLILHRTDLGEDVVFGVQREGAFVQTSTGVIPVSQRLTDVQGKSLDALFADARTQFG
jgi:hypothetical protein